MVASIIDFDKKRKEHLPYARRQGGKVVHLVWFKDYMRCGIHLMHTSRYAKQGQFEVCLTCQRSGRK